MAADPSEHPDEFGISRILSGDFRQEVMSTNSTRSDQGSGSNVLIGPGAHLSGCTVEDNVFVATGATVFNGASLGAASEVRVRGVVHINSVLPAHAVVPIGWIAVGDPA